MKPIADILEDAARLIEKPGAWMQEDFCNATDLTRATCFCIEGAVARAAGMDCMDAETWCDENLSPLVFAGENAAHWNDAPERTQAEVVAALRQAATLARGDTA